MGDKSEHTGWTLSWRRASLNWCLLIVNSTDETFYVLYLSLSSPYESFIYIKMCPAPGLEQPVLCCVVTSNHSRRGSGKGDRAPCEPTSVYTRELPRS